MNGIANAPRRIYLSPAMGFLAGVALVSLLAFAMELAK